MSNDTIKKQLDHRTIREFKDVQVPDEVYKTLLDVAQRTPTSKALDHSFPPVLKNIHHVF